MLAEPVHNGYNTAEKRALECDKGAKKNYLVEMSRTKKTLTRIRNRAIFTMSKRRLSIQALSASREEKLTYDRE
jgi:hypothetical protein